MTVNQVENSEIQLLVQRAEASVVNVKDPELRKIAFARVLDSFLTREAGPPTDNNQKKTALRRVSANKGGPSGYIEDLAAEGFFRKQATLSDVKRELANRGHVIPLTSLSGPMQRMCKRKILRRHRGTVAGKETFVYSNW